MSWGGGNPPIGLQLLAAELVQLRGRAVPGYPWLMCLATELQLAPGLPQPVWVVQTGGLESGHAWGWSRLAAPV